jgi:zinc-binding in reverse transcriptase
MGLNSTKLRITLTINETTINHHTNSTQFIRDLNNLLLLFRASITTDPQGTLLWKWTPNHLFSTNFVYQKYNDPSIPRPQFRQVWRTRAPPRVHFFLWLLLHDKLNTTENLQKKGWTTITSCVLCFSNAMESVDHLFSNYPTATHILLSTIATPPQQKVYATWSYKEHA